MPYLRSSSSYPPSLAVLKVVAAIPRANFQARVISSELACLFSSPYKPSQSKSHQKTANSEHLLIKWKCSNTFRFFNQKKKNLLEIPTLHICLDIVIPIALQQVVLSYYQIDILLETISCFKVWGTTQHLAPNSLCRHSNCYVNSHSSEATVHLFRRIKAFKNGVWIFHCQPWVFALRIYSVLLYSILVIQLVQIYITATLPFNI